jgi:hypothetical protein
MAITAPSTSLTGQTIASSYDQVLFLDNAAGMVDGTLKVVSAVVGKSALSIDNNHALIKAVNANNAAAFEVQQADATSILKIAADTPAVTLIGTLTVGVDNTGHDVTLFGATSGKKVFWDESADTLFLTCTTDIDGTVAVGVDGTGYDVTLFGDTAGQKVFWDESADTLFQTCTVDIDGTVTVGVDDTGYDVKFFGATASAYMLWDESADDLILAGAAGLSVAGATTMTGTLTIGVDDTGLDVKFFGATTGKSLLWDESADSLIITGDATDALKVSGGLDIDGVINVGLDDTGYDVKFFGATASAYMLWDESADDLILAGAAGLSVAGASTFTGVATFNADPIIGGTTPTLTIGDAGSEDTMLVFDGNAADWRLGVDDSEDDFEIGVGSTHGTTAGFRMDSSGHVTKIGQDTPANLQVLMWDTSGSPARAVWAAVSSTGVEASELACDNLTQGDAAVNLTTSTGDITVDTNDGDINLEVPGSQFIYMTDGSTNRFGFEITATPIMHVTGAFKIDCSSDLYLSPNGGDIVFLDDDVAWLKFTNNAGSARIYNPVVDETISFMDTALSRTYMRILNDIDGADGIEFPGKNGTDNVVIGKQAGLSLTASGNQNVFIGTDVASDGSVSGDDNVGIGYQALEDIISGTDNIAIGTSSQKLGQSGTYNISIGTESLYTNESAINSTAIGYQALRTLATGAGNVAIGVLSMSLADGCHSNVAIGGQSLRTCDGNSNTAVGDIALQKLNDGAGNVALGKSSLKNLGSTPATDASSFNIGIGYQAGNLLASAAQLKNANSCIYIGSSTQASADDIEHEIVIGTQATGKGSNTCMIGNGSLANIYNGKDQAAWSQVSDERLKRNIEDWDVGLDAINGLRIRQFQWKKKDDMPDGHVKNSERINHGIVAQEAQKVLPEMVSEGADGYMSANTDPMVWAMVNAIQELSSTVKALEAKVESLESASSSRTNIEL